MFISRFVWQNSLNLKNVFPQLAAFTSGTSNSGFFGLPLVSILLGSNFVKEATLMTVGYWLYENSVGFLVAAGNKLTLRESFSKMLKLPGIYAFLIGLTLNFFGFNSFIQNMVYLKTVNYFRGTVSLLGMMLIGLGLADLKSFKINWKFLLIVSFGKFILWPVITVIFILLTANFGILNKQNIQTLLLMSVVPISANSIAIASFLECEPGEVSFTCFLTIVVALFYIPGFFDLIITPYFS